MNNREYWSLIARYLAQSLTPEEEQELMEWVRLDSTNQNRLDEARKIWNITGAKLSLPEIETQKEWLALVKRIERGDTGEPGILQKHRNIIFTSLRIAAVLLFTFCIYWLFTKTDEQLTPPARFTYSTGDSVERYYLPDSSFVWMNINSSLTFDKGFITRDIQLKGEAFFSVQPDSKRPFVIAAGDTRTSVMGTTFDVKAREKEPIEVVVVTGKVEFSTTDSIQNGKIILGPQDKGTYNPKTRAISKKRNTDPTFLAWRKKNNLIYEQEKSGSRHYLTNAYTYKKNAINQTLIEGRITNRASIAAYRKIRLKITSINSRGKKSEQTFDVSSNKSVQPGESIAYRQTFLDVFSKKTKVSIEIVSAQVSN